MKIFFNFFPGLIGILLVYDEEKAKEARQKLNTAKEKVIKRRIDIYA